MFPCFLVIHFIHACLTNLEERCIFFFVLYLNKTDSVVFLSELTQLKRKGKKSTSLQIYQRIYGMAKTWKWKKNVRFCLNFSTFCLFFFVKPGMELADNKFNVGPMTNVFFCDKMSLSFSLGQRFFFFAEILYAKIFGHLWKSCPWNLRIFKQHREISSFSRSLISESMH